MADLIDITAPSVLHGIHKDLRDTVKVAASMGWTGRKRSSGGLILYSPDREHTVQVPSTIGDARSAKNVARQVMRYTPHEVKVELAQQIEEGSLTDDMFEATETIIKDAAGVFPAAMTAHLEPEEVLPTVEPDPLPRTLVSEEPWMAIVNRKAGEKTGSRYPSPAVLERKWSDGSTDYLCRFCRVWSNVKPHSVSAHYAKGHSAKGETEKRGRQADLITERHVVIDAPFRPRTAHLAKEIEAALIAVGNRRGDTTAHEWAVAIAEAIVQERVAGGQEKVEDDPGPLTDADLVARMKRLLLRDETDRLQRAETETANLRAQIVEVESEKREAVEKWQALKDLVNT